MLKSLPFLAPTRVYIPWDDAIDRDAWEMTPDEYLHAIATADTEPPPPPARPGQRVSSITLAPMSYAAYAYALHLLRNAGDEWPMDPAVQSHVMRHAIVDVDIVTDGPAVRIAREDGPYGMRLTADTWGRLGFFCDPQIWGLLCLACLVRTSRAACVAEH